MSADSLDEKLKDSTIDPYFLDELKKIHLEDPNDVEKMFNLAQGLSRAAEPALRREAKFLFTEILHNMSGSTATSFYTDSIFFMAQLCYQEGDYEKALEHAENLLKSNPDNPQISQLHLSIRQRHKEDCDRKAAEESDALVMTGVGTALLVGVGLGLSVLFGGGSKKR
jgi:tetratricopeptide (TPR) repeat protein